MMRLLLDTHTLIWFDAEPDRLSDTSRGVLADENNVLLISIASIWEMQIKIQTGRLNLRSSLSVLISEQMQNAGLQILPIEPKHIYALKDLPDVHRDPFDRIMIAQAIVEDLGFVSADRVLSGYPVRQLW
jgi:PIN domain nuclease of toxin-antitoxin system